MDCWSRVRFVRGTKSGLPWPWRCLLPLWTGRGGKGASDMLQISLYKRMFRGRGCKVAMGASAGGERFLHAMDEAIS